jgi:hypothetical protein
MKGDLISIRAIFVQHPPYGTKSGGRPASKS